VGSTTPVEHRRREPQTLCFGRPAELFLPVVYHYLTTDLQGHPFFRVVIPASLIHVPLMSTKVLNASMWDELESPSGQIIHVTQVQRQIAMKLLTESLSREEEALSDVSIASLSAFLTFEVCFNINHGPPPPTES
jgi:hypothetical protein